MLCFGTSPLIIFICVIGIWSEELFSGEKETEIGYTTTSGDNYYLSMNNEKEGRAEFVNPGPGNQFKITPSSDKDNSYEIKLGKRFALGYEEGDTIKNATFDDISHGSPKTFIIKSGRQGRYVIRFGDNCILFHGKNSTFSKRSNTTSVDAYFECNDAYLASFTHIIGLFWIKEVDGKPNDGKSNVNDDEKSKSSVKLKGIN